MVVVNVGTEAVIFVGAVVEAIRVVSTVAVAVATAVHDAGVNLAALSVLQLLLLQLLLMLLSILFLLRLVAVLLAGAEAPLGSINVSLTVHNTIKHITPLQN